MTRDEITKLHGRELDAAVAEKVMGWRSARLGTQAKIDPIDRGWYTKKWERKKPSWQPSTDITDAWKVVEKMKEIGLTVQRFSTGDLMGDKWQAHFADAYREIAHEGDRDYFADAETPQLAICRAALLAMTQ